MSFIQILTFIFFLQISELNVEAVEDIDRYISDIEEGRCIAWCTQTFGNWSLKTTSPEDPLETCTFLESREKNKECLYRCLPDNEPCNGCDQGCKFMAINGRHGRCHEQCNNNESCEKGCSHMKWLKDNEDNTQMFNWTQEWLNINTKNYPSSITPSPSMRTTSNIGISWSYNKQYDDPRSIVFLVYIKKTYSKEEKKDLPRYIKPTPEHYFVLENADTNACYQFNVMSVTNATVLGANAYNDAMHVDPMVHVENITATSVYVWFKRRWCEEKLKYSLPIGRQEWDLQEKENDIHWVQVTGLQPNNFYHIAISRKNLDSDNDNHYFSYQGNVTTLPAPPNSTVSVYVKTIKATHVTVHITVNKNLMWRLPVLNWTITIRHVGGESRRVVMPAADIFGSDESISFRLTPSVEGLIPYTSYCISAIATNKMGPGPEGEEACFTTESAPPPPPILEGVLALRNGTTLLTISPPSPTHGVIKEYHVEYRDSGEQFVNLSFNATGQQRQVLIIRNLKAFQVYMLEVCAVTDKGPGKCAEQIFTTPQSKPDQPPNITSCVLKAVDGVIAYDLKWEMERYALNGVAKRYGLIVNVSELDDGKMKTVVNETYSISNLTSPTSAVKRDPLAQVSYNHKLIVEMRLNVSNSVETSEYSATRICAIDPSLKMGINVVGILVPILCILAIVVILLFGFFYFFRFKSYKETPYEEIKKLIRPDAFSPCQHCLHNKGPKRWDVFICYVSEDTNYVIQLKEAFERENIEVFFAKDELSWGCQLHRVINEGLRDSKYGLVVLSTSFIEKSTQWTSSELSSLHSKSRLSDQDCILPIWKCGITEKEVGTYDMTLVGIQAMKEEEMTCDLMAQELKKKLKRDSCWGCMLRNGKPGKGCHMTSSPADLMLMTPDTPGTCTTPLVSPENSTAQTTPTSTFPCTDV